MNFKILVKIFSTSEFLKFSPGFPAGRDFQHYVRGGTWYASLKGPLCHGSWGYGGSWTLILTKKFEKNTWKKFLPQANLKVIFSLKNFTSSKPWGDLLIEWWHMSRVLRLWWLLNLHVDQFFFKKRIKKFFSSSKPWGIFS